MSARGLSGTTRQLISWISCQLAGQFSTPVRHWTTLISNDSGGVTPPIAVVNSLSFWPQFDCRRRDRKRRTVLQRGRQWRQPHYLYQKKKRPTRPQLSINFWNNIGIEKSNKRLRRSFTVVSIDRCRAEFEPKRKSVVLGNGRARAVHRPTRGVKSKQTPGDQLQRTREGYHNCKLVLNGRIFMEQ